MMQAEQAAARQAQDARQAWWLVCLGKPASHPVSPRCQIDRDATAEAEAEVAAPVFLTSKGWGWRVSMYDVLAKPPFVFGVASTP